MNYVILDLVLCDGDVLQNDLQPHCHHACHPVDQAGADVTGHPPLKPEKNKTFTSGITAAVFFCRLSFSVFCPSVMELSFI